jgi:hypothetical protein
MPKGRKGKPARRKLVKESLEKISREIFIRHSDTITDLIGNSPGIYALYDGSELCYVGKATDLRRRVKQHLKDRHLASWTHFSLFLVRRADQISEVESLVIHIANPNGNRAIPSRKEGKPLLKRLVTLVKNKQKDEIRSLFGERKKRARAHKGKGLKALKNLVSSKQRLYRAYKGKEYTAFLLPSGRIRLKGRSYDSATAAAKSIVDRRTVNGWTFWYIKDSKGEWVRLSDFSD